MSEAQASLWGVAIDDDDVYQPGKLLARLEPPAGMLLAYEHLALASDTR